jgi:hypothetical protein
MNCTDISRSWDRHDLGTAVVECILVGYWYEH